MSSYPILAVTGPRQAGKTTLVRSVFADRPYVSLENLDERAYAEEDPRGFLARFPDGAVLDEVQQVPALFSYLQGLVDEDGRMGLFVLTGSQQFSLRSGISQSLAGRVGMVRLLPFSSEELAAGGKMPERLEDLLFQGAYPPIYERPVDPQEWYDNYVATYVERDVRQIRQIQNLDTFRRFVAQCAANIGQRVNLSKLAQGSGIDQKTADAWLGVLEDSFIIHRLRPHEKNFGKRISKQRKLFFYDVGLAVRLLGLQDPEQLKNLKIRGALFESWVVSELLKARYHHGLRGDNLYFWRDHRGLEIDVLIDLGLSLVPVEIKVGITLQPQFFKTLRHWRELAGDAAAGAWLVYGGEGRSRRGDVEVASWHDLETLIDLCVPPRLRTAPQPLSRPDYSTHPDVDATSANSTRS